MKSTIYYILILLFATSCEAENQGATTPRTILEITAPQSSEQGEPIAIARNKVFRKEFRYLLPNMSWASVYDYRTEFAASGRVAEAIAFHYQEYRYRTTVPPVEEQKVTAPQFIKTNLESGFFWRIDNIFTVYLRKADNPGFTFNTAGHYIESASTKYMLPTNVIFQ